MSNIDIVEKGGTPPRNGGVNKPAPYKTKMVRCPEPIKENIHYQINLWHLGRFPEEKENLKKLMFEELNNLIEELNINLKTPRSDNLNKILNNLNKKTT
jgi:hypothetical protein